MSTRRAVVSVVIPTYHRPDHLRRAVVAVLDQELPVSWTLDVIIAVSDKESANDLATAEALARDARVRSVVAGRPGPGVARNAAIQVARGEALAFTDDDCVPQPGWLKYGLTALERADLVQGRTCPAGPIPPMGRSIHVEPPSWLWESCNLLARREAVERAGLFDDAWNPTGRVGDHFGEDVEWGWRMVRSGASTAFVPEALVHHAVEPGSLCGFLRYQARVRHFPQLFRSAPEARRHFFFRYFFSRRHAMLTGIVPLLPGAAVAHVRGERRKATWCISIAIAAWLSPFLWRMAKADFHQLCEARPARNQTGRPRFFANRRQAVLATAVGLAMTGYLANTTGQTRTAKLSRLVVAVLWGAPLLRISGKEIAMTAGVESVQFFPLAFESIRHRRMLL